MENEVDLAAYHKQQQERVGVNAKPSEPRQLTKPCRRCGEMTPADKWLPPSLVTCSKCAPIVEQERREAAEKAERERQERMEAARRRQEQEEREGRERRLARLRFGMADALLLCGVPQHWLGASFDECQDLPRDLVSAVKHWAESPKGIMLLYGPPGAGKTWLAVAALRHVFDKGIMWPCNCRFIGERGYLARLKAGFDGNKRAFDERGPSDEHLESVYLGYLENGTLGDFVNLQLDKRHPRHFPLLVYDDLGAERATDWARSETCGLIEARHADDLPTLLSSNLTPDEIAKSIDGRLTSRIAESGLMLAFPKRDLRVNGTLGKTGSQ